MTPDFQDQAGEAAVTQTEDGVRIIHLNGRLRAKAAVKANDGVKVDEMAVAVAEAAMKELAPEFQKWMQDEVSRLIAAFEAFRDAPQRERDVGPLFRVSHDMRSQATIFGYPLASEIAGSLSKLLDQIESEYLPMQLVSHHVDAIKAVYRDDIRDYANPIAAMIVHNLRRAIERVVEARHKAIQAEVGKFNRQA